MNDRIHILMQHRLIAGDGSRNRLVPVVPHAEHEQTPACVVVKIAPGAPFAALAPAEAPTPLAPVKVITVND